MTKENLRVVFDCMIFLQAAMSEKSISFKLFKYLDENAFSLFISEEVLEEVNEVLRRPLIRVKNPRITDESVEALLNRTRHKAEKLDKIPREFEYPHDSKDEKYINLAIASKANYLVSQDNDLLDLMSGFDDKSKEFRQRFRRLKIILPVEFLNLLTAEDLPPKS